jgi:SAM-dependent methyltransferase
MEQITDDRGYNQVFNPSEAMRVRTDRRAQRILGAMTSVVPQDILEIGSGTGEMADLLASHTAARVTGADLCAPFVAAAAEKYRRPNLDFRVLDLGRADLQAQLGQSFDYIVGNGILHHLRADLVDILARLRTLLRPGGRLIFWEPNLHNPYVYLIFTFPRMRRWAKLEPGEMAFTREELAGAFRQAGFSQVDASLGDFLVPGTPTALVGAVTAIGDLVERVPGLNRLAQSVFVAAGG